MLGTTHVERLSIVRKMIEEDVTVDLEDIIRSSTLKAPASMKTNLWFDEDQVDEDHDVVVFHIFVREAPTARALGQSNITVPCHRSTGLARRG